MRVLLLAAVLLLARPAASPCNATGDDWVACRQRLIETAFGELPTRTHPDHIIRITPRNPPTALETSAGETRRAPALGNNGGEMGGVTRNVRSPAHFYTSPGVCYMYLSAACSACCLHGSVVAARCPTDPTLLCDVRRRPSSGPSLTAR